MPATVTLCQRTGNVPGNVMENVPAIAWKAVDDVLTPYDLYRAVLGLGTNSYTVYNYLKFSGSFTTIANVNVTHSGGTFGQGIKLYASPTIADSSQRVVYTKPVRTTSGVATTDLTSLGASVQLMVGNAPSGQDGAGYDGKGTSASNTGQPIYSSYLVTQLQVAANAQTGDLSNVSLQISYDEI
jgi:hypothetical protein